MRISVPDQLLDAGLSLALGMAAGVLYDFFRAIRYRLRSKFITTLTDILFWFICAVALFCLGMTAGGGKQRIFMTILAFLGGTLYFITLSRFILALCKKLVDLIALFLFCVSRPAVWIAQIVKKMILFIKKLFISSKLWYKIRCGNVKSSNKRRNRRRLHQGGEYTETETGRHIYENSYSGSFDLHIGNTGKSMRKNRRRKAGSVRAGPRGRRHTARKRRAAVRH